MTANSLPVENHDYPVAQLPANVTRVPTFFGMTPSSIDEAMQLAERIANSGLCPNEYRKKPEDVFMAGAYAAALGLDWLQALQNIAMVNGRASVYGDLFRAMIVGHPDCVDIKEYFENESPEYPDDMAAVCEITRRGRSPVVRKFSVGDAKEAKLWGKSGPWTQYKKIMLIWRALGFAGRAAFADRLRGIWLVEESRDIPIEREVAGEARSTSQPAARKIANNDDALADALADEPATEPEQGDVIEQEPEAQSEPTADDGPGDEQKAANYELLDELLIKAESVEHVTAIFEDAKEQAKKKYITREQYDDLMSKIKVRGEEFKQAEADANA